MHQNKRISALECLLVLLSFSACVTGALLLPLDQCPDEIGRLVLTDWIVNNGTLPTGNEPAVVLPGWGFSYALRPYMSAVVGAFFKRAALCFTDLPNILLAASRMCSVLSVTFCCLFCLRLGHRLFEKQGSTVLFASVVCFLPQVMFIGMYQNNDSLSLFAVSMMLYYLVEGYDRKWPVKSCVGLAVAFSVGLLSYYSIYGWLLTGAVFCVLAVLTDPKQSGKSRLILKRAALIAGICLLLTGWFFIRNAMLHNGDFLGIASEEASRTYMRERGYVVHEYTCYRDEGMSVLQFLRLNNYWWLRTSMRSFIGEFGYMQIVLPMIQYGIYYAAFGCAVILFFAILPRQETPRRDRLLMLMMLSSSVITVFLHFWQSYARDLQPQGRYIISVIFPLAFMLAYGIDKIPATVPDPSPRKTAALQPAAAITLAWLALFAWACLGTMAKMIP